MIGSVLSLLVLFLGVHSKKADNYCTEGVGPKEKSAYALAGVRIVGETKTIDNGEGCEHRAAKVQNYTDEVADLVRGLPYSLMYVVEPFCDQKKVPKTGAAYISGVFIDWNGTGNFTNDHSQRVAWAFDDREPEFDIEVPATATLGKTRMRIMLMGGHGSSDLLPCATYPHGAVKDFTLEVIDVTPPPTPRSPTPPPYVPTPAPPGGGGTSAGTVALIAIVCLVVGCGLGIGLYRYKSAQNDASDPYHNLQPHTHMGGEKEEDERPAYQQVDL